MNATEELRALLDAKGVEWWPMHDVEAGYYQDHDTEFVVDGRKYTAHEWGGRLTVYGLTPAQAVEATLGRGTCEYCKDGKFDGQTVMISNHGWQRINFCPNCGARCVG